MKFFRIPSILVVMALVMALCLPVASAAVGSVGVTASASGTTVYASATVSSYSGDAYYTWRIRPSYSGNYTQVSNSTTASTYTFTGLSYNTTYFVSVEVRDSSGDYKASTEYSVVTNYNGNYYGYNYGYNNGVATIISSSATMYSSASSSSSEIMTLSYGAQVNVYSTSGSFAYISYGGYNGYVYQSSLSNQNYYSGYYYDPYYYGYYGYYYDGSYYDPYYYNYNYYDPYNYSGYYNPYYYGSYNNVGSATGTATVGAYSAAVYTGPSGSYGILGYLNSGATVTTYNSVGDFTAVNYAGSIGYILSSQLANRTNYSNSASGTTGAYLNTSSTVRGSASSYGTSLGTINANTYVTVYGIEGSWARINWGSGYGYVPTSYISYTGGSVVTSVPTTSTGSKTVIADSVTVRDAASVSGKALGTLTRGMVVGVSQTSSGWIYITSGSLQGWVYGENLK